MVEAWVPRYDLNFLELRDGLFAVTVWLVTGIIEPEIYLVRFWFVEAQETFPQISVVTYGYQI